MTSRYDVHASLIEELFAAGESFTGIARQLEQKFSIPLDASGLRRWLLRRLAKKGERAPLVNPNALLNAAIAVQQTAAIERVQQESQQKQKKKKAIALDPEPEKTVESEFSLKDIIAEAEDKVEQRLLKK